MSKRDLFLAGTPFKAGRLLFTSFRYNNDGEHIQMQAFHPVADQWLYYCKVDFVDYDGFLITMIVLGKMEVQTGFLFEDMEFIQAVLKEGGTDVDV